MDPIHLTICTINICKRSNYKTRHFHKKRTQLEAVVGPGSLISVSYKTKGAKLTDCSGEQLNYPMERLKKLSHRPRGEERHFLANQSISRRGRRRSDWWGADRCAAHAVRGKERERDFLPQGTARLLYIYAPARPNPLERCPGTQTFSTLHDKKIPCARAECHPRAISSLYIALRSSIKYTTHTPKQTPSYLIWAKIPALA